MDGRADSRTVRHFGIALSSLSSRAATVRRLDGQGKLNQVLEIAFDKQDRRPRLACKSIVRRSMSAAMT